jgi:D-alanyl-D-alanine carboxypeptidase
MTFSVRSVSPAVSLVLALGGCDSTTRRPGPAAAVDVGGRLQALLDSTVAGAPSIPGLLLSVHAPARQVAWQGAAGLADRATGATLTPEHVFRVASNTKTYVAAAILRLMEDGKLALSDPIARHLLPATAARLRARGYDPTVLTVRQLLQHVSGLYDYATDDHFIAGVLGHPDHRWTRREQLDLALEQGKPYGRPGEVYHYSDTGYILLGEIVEHLTERPLGAAVAELVGFSRLGLSHTWFETLDSVPPGTGPRAHQYQDSIDIYRFDPSFDLYGGGGIVAPIGELESFYRSLGSGAVFRQRATFDTMITISAPSLVADSTRGYGMGIGRRRIAGVTCWGHGGHWGSMGIYCPSIDVSVAIATNRSGSPAYDAFATLAAIVGVVQGAAPATK